MMNARLMDDLAMLFSLEAFAADTRAIKADKRGDHVAADRFHDDADYLYNVASELQEKSTFLGAEE